MRYADLTPERIYGMSEGEVMQWVWALEKGGYQGAANRVLATWKQRQQNTLQQQQTQQTEEQLANQRKSMDPMRGATQMALGTAGGATLGKVGEAGWNQLSTKVPQWWDSAKGLVTPSTPAPTVPATTSALNTASTQSMPYGVGALETSGYGPAAATGAANLTYGASQAMPYGVGALDTGLWGAEAANAANAANLSYGAAETGVAGGAGAAGAGAAGEAGLLGTVGSYAPFIAAPLGAYGAYQQFSHEGSRSGTGRQALSGAASGAAMGSLGGPIGMGIGAVIGGAAGLISSLTGSGKGKEQRERDAVRGAFEDAGVFPDNDVLEFSDGGSFDFSKDGGARLTNEKGEERRYTDIDWSAEGVDDIVAAVDPLVEALMPEADEDLQDAWVGYFVNAAQEGTDPMARVQELYQKFGYTGEEGRSQLTEEINASETEDENKADYINTLNTMLDPYFTGQNPQQAGQTPPVGTIQTPNYAPQQQVGTIQTPNFAGIGAAPGQLKTPGLIQPSFTKTGTGLIANRKKQVRR